MHARSRSTHRYAKVEGFCLGFFYQTPEGFIGYYEHAYDYAD